MSLYFRQGLFRGMILGLICGMLSIARIGQAEDAPTYQLRYKFTPQQSLYFISQNDTEYVVEYAQAKDTVLHTSMFLRQMNIVNVDAEGVAEVQLMLDRAYMTANNAGVESVYNSAQPDKVPTEFAGVHHSLGRPLSVRMNPQGKILPLPNSSAPVIQDDLLIQFSPEPMPVGGTWKDQFEVSIPIDQESKLSRQVKMQRRYTLLSVDQGIATISVATVPLSPISDPFQESLLIQRKHKGELKFDLENGCLVDRILRIDDKVVGNQGEGSALAVKLVKVDRQISAAQTAKLDLTKLLVPLKVAAESSSSTK